MSVACIVKLDRMKRIVLLKPTTEMRAHSTHDTVVVYIILYGVSHKPAYDDVVHDDHGVLYGYNFRK